MIQTKADQQLIERLFDTQPDSVVWFMPVFDALEEIVDFEVRYCNAAAVAILKASQQEVIGTRLLSTSLIDKGSIQKIFEQCKQVWRDEQTLEFTYHSPGLDRYFNVQRSKILDGVLSITRDRTNEVRLELEKQRQWELTNKMINSSPNCIVLCQAVYNSEGGIDDLKLLMVNEKILHDLKRPRQEIEGLTYCELHPAVRTNGLLNLLTSVITTGKPVHQEIYLEVFGGWFHLSADRVEDDKLIAIYHNITETKNSEKKVINQAMLLNKLINSSPCGISWYTSVRNEAGEIVDFRMKLGNEKSAEITGFSLEELYKHTVKELMEMRGTSNFFPVCKNVVETGVPVNLEYYSQSLNKWMVFNIVPFDDGYLLNYVDITDIKNYAEKFERQTVLLQSILDGSINGLFALEAIKNEQGEVVDMEIIKINKAFTRILGLGEEIVGKRYLSIFPGSKEAGIFDMHVQVLKTGIPIEHEFYYAGENYNSWYRIAITKSGENGLIQTFTDTTESMRNKLTLETSAAHLQNVIDSTQTGIFLASPEMRDGQIVDFRFKTVNKALSGYAFKQPAELIDQLHGDIFPAYRENGVFEVYKQVCETGEEAHFEKQYVADGFSSWMDVVAKKIGTDLLVTFHDFTSLKELQLHLESSIDDLKKSNERLAEFAHVASHDLKEPLRKVRMHTNFLEQRFATALGEEGYNHVLRIQSATLRMQALITDLLTYSQVSKLPDNFTTLNLKDLVQDVLADLEASVQTHALIFIVVSCHRCMATLRNCASCFKTC